MEKRRNLSRKSNWPRGCLPVMTIANQVTKMTKKAPMLMTMPMMRAGMIQMKRKPFVSRSAGSS